MKNIRSVLSVFVICACISACTGNYGKEYKADKLHNVYYKGEGALETDAVKLADLLKSIEYFQDNITASVQFEKIKDTFNLRFVVDESKLTSQIENSFLIIGSFASDSVFNKAPVTVQLTDSKLKPVKNLGYAKPISDFDK